MAQDTYRIRPALTDEADTVAGIARASRAHFLPYLPVLHSLEGDQRFYRNRVFPACEVWVAERGGQIVGFCAYREGWLDHLHLLPGHEGNLIGTTLLDKAKTRCDHLRLWVF